jgi:hypothetical protein
MDGTVVGSLFLDERGPIAAVDPLTASCSAGLCNKAYASSTK